MEKPDSQSDMSHPDMFFMSEKSAAEITQILQDWNDGDEDAKERLIPFVYDELKRQARC